MPVSPTQKFTETHLYESLMASEQANLIAEIVSKPQGLQTVFSRMRDDGVIVGSLRSIFPEAQLKNDNDPGVRFERINRKDNRDGVELGIRVDQESIGLLDFGFYCGEVYEAAKRREKGLGGLFSQMAASLRRGPSPISVDEDFEDKLIYSSQRGVPTTKRKTLFLNAIGDMRRRYHNENLSQLNDLEKLIRNGWYIRVRGQSDADDSPTRVYLCRKIELPNG